MIDDRTIEHQLIGTGFRQQRLEAMTNLLRVAHQRAGQGLLHRHQLTGRPLIAKLDDRRGQLARITAMEAQELLLHGTELEAGLLLAVGGDHVDADHRMGLGPTSRGAILATIDLQRLQQHGGSKMGGKPERQTHRRCQLRAVEAGAQQPDGQMQSLTGYRLHRADLVAKVAHQFAHIGRKIIHLTTAHSPQRPHGALIGTWGAAKAKVDAVGIERSQGAKLFGNHQRRVVRQHDATRADPQSGGGFGQMTDQHRGGGAGNARHVVMFGQPVALVTPTLGMAGKIP